MAALRSLTLTCCATALLASVAFALEDPALRVTYPEGIPQVQLDGSFPQSRYTVYRSASPYGTGEPITTLDVLCLGACYARDLDAEPGATYWYRFELTLSGGAPVVFGPYAVTISAELAARVALRVMPNPVRDGARIDMRLVLRPGDGPVPAHAVLVDLQGRTARTLFRGTLPSGTTSLRWDGRGEGGHSLAAGAYFLRLSTPLGTRIVRVLRVN